MKKRILLSALIMTIAFGFCGCKKNDATVHFASETEQKAVVSSGVNRQKEVSDIESDSEKSSSAKAESADSDSTEWCVYICGQIANPGVYRIKPGSRICDLVDMAGGMLEDADRNFWNLAEELYDGEMLYFPTTEELKSDLLPENGRPAADDADTKASDGRININSASVEELTTLSGIGESKAKSIVDYRTENGDFSAIEDITNVSGIGEAMFNKIKDDITVN